MNAATISAGLATVLAAVQLVPQVVKLRRVGSTAGISPTWALLGVSINGGWVLYRWSQELWLGIPSPAMAAVLYAVTLAMVSRLEPRLRPSKFAALAMGGSLGGAAAAGGWLAMGVVLAFPSAFQAVPLLWTAFRSSQTTAIAPQVWMIGLTQAILWGHYGWLQGDIPLMVYSVATSVASTALLARYVVAARLATATGR